MDLLEKKKRKTNKSKHTTHQKTNHKKPTKHKNAKASLRADHLSTVARNAYTVKSIIKVMKLFQSPLKNASLICFNFFVTWKIIKFKVK